MTTPSTNTPGPRVLTHPVVLFWFASLFLLVPTVTWFDDFVLAVAFMILPAIILCIWLASVPVWLLGRALINSLRRRWPVVWLCLAALPLGAAIAFAGLKCGDFAAVMAYGPLLKSEVAAIRAGATSKRSGGLFASSTMAFKLTGGFLDISNGIVYDESGQVGRLIKLSPSERPVDWQKDAVDVLSCRGGARHLFGNFYAVTVSVHSCD